MQTKFCIAKGYHLVADLFRVSLFIELGCPENFGIGPWHFYDK